MKRFVLKSAVLWLSLSSVLRAAGRKPEFTTFETTTLHMEHREATITRAKADKKPFNLFAAS